MYPLLGPLIGYVSVVAVFVIYLIATEGFAGAGLQFRRDAFDILQAVGFAYIFGSAQAIATGIYAARALAKTGRSRLIFALTVATVASLFIVFVMVLIESMEAMRMIFFLLPPALIATIGLRPLERYFRTPDAQ